MTGTISLNAPRMIYHWEEEQQGNLKCYSELSYLLDL